jgi:formylglycine-generating enzyme required for sulfatase activity
MKYEAKTGSATVAATTQASGTPQVNITQTNAITACSLNGAGYGLINNNEWMTIARNIEGQGANWTGGTVGSGGLWRGHSDGSPNNALEANTDDNDGYFGTGNVSPSIERRTHTLSNGETIWDLSGNVWEWTSDTILGQNKPNNSSGNFWQQWTAISNFGTLSYDLTRPSNTSWNSTQNMGQYYAGGVTGTTTFAFLRGGRWGDTTAAGVFTLRLPNAPSNSNSFIGFRCVLR